MVCSVFAFVLLAIWPAVTSHALLEQLEVIHHVHDDHDDDGGSHEHNGDNHEFADGDYTRPVTEFGVQPSLGGIVFCEAPSSLSIEELSLRSALPGPAPPGSAATTFLKSSWQFLSRTALPVRAPSSLL